MSKHTAGPWDYTKELQGYYIWQTARECGNNPQRVALAAWGENAEQEEANARLIAAAPEMLEALRAVQKAQNALMQPFEVIAKVDDAIRKATEG